VPYLEAVGVHNPEKNEINIFAVNRNLKEAMNLEAEIAGFGGIKLAEHRVMCHSDLNACNSVREEKVKPAVLSGGRIDSAAGTPRLEITLPPASWNLIRLETAHNVTA
jgi:alpha-N-arabinofuranosidase